MQISKINFLNPNATSFQRGDSKELTKKFIRQVENEGTFNDKYAIDLYCERQAEKVAKDDNIDPDNYDVTKSESFKVAKEVLKDDKFIQTYQKFCLLYYSKIMTLDQLKEAQKLMSEGVREEQAIRLATSKQFDI